MKYPELYKNTLIVISAYCSHICIIVFDPFARTVTGPPVDDPKGRWRRGGGINVPVNVQVRLPERQAREVKRKVEMCGCQVKLSPAE